VKWQRSAIALSGALLLGDIAAAEEFGWRDAEGKAEPDTEWRKSSQGFGAMLLNTSESDWYGTWHRPDVPHHMDVEPVRKGGQIVTMIFIANPAPGPDGGVYVLCDLKVVKPDGTHAHGVEGQPCLWGILLGQPGDPHLARFAHTFIGEEGDPTGTWKVNVTVRDEVRDVAIELRTSFEYVGDAPSK
jgi:hypothetical protein